MCNVVALCFSYVQIYTQQLRRKLLRDILMKSIYLSSYTVTHEMLNLLHFTYLLYRVEKYYVLCTQCSKKKMFVVNAVRCDNHPTSRPLQDDLARFQPLRCTISQNISSTERQLRR